MRILLERQSLSTSADPRLPDFFTGVLLHLPPWLSDSATHFRTQYSSKPSVMFQSLLACADSRLRNVWYERVFCFWPTRGQPILQFNSGCGAFLDANIFPWEHRVYGPWKSWDRGAHPCPLVTPFEALQGRRDCLVMVARNRSRSRAVRL